MSKGYDNKGKEDHDDSKNGAEGPVDMSYRYYSCSIREYTIRYGLRCDGGIVRLRGC